MLSVWGEAVNISTGEQCLQNPVASKFGARLAEEKKSGRPRRVLPEANKQCSLLLHTVVVVTGRKLCRQR